MVQCQLLPVGIRDDELLRAFEEIKREDFLPTEYSNMAYEDRNIKYKGKLALRPILVAHLIESSKIEKNHKVLYIGGVFGYGPALVKNLCENVVFLEEFEVTGTENKIGPLEKGWPEEGPYDAIIIEDIVTKMPEEIINQCHEKARISAIIKNDYECYVGSGIKSTNMKFERIFETMLY